MVLTHTILDKKCVVSLFHESDQDAQQGKTKFVQAGKFTQSQT